MRHALQFTANEEFWKKEEEIVRNTGVYQLHGIFTRVHVYFVIISKEYRIPQVLEVILYRHIFKLLHCL
jgi:hypothetical protein